VNANNIWVFYFHAEWCMPCRNVDPVMREIEHRRDINVAWVDVDYQATAVKRFGVQGVPTVIVRRGAETLDWIGPGDCQAPGLAERVMGWVE